MFRQHTHPHIYTQAKRAKRVATLTDYVTTNLPAAHPHAKEDLVLHDKDSDAEEHGYEGDIATPVVEERFEEGDDSVDVL